MQTTVYFMSRHTPDKGMIAHLEANLGELNIVQFGGSYSDIRTTTKGLSFAHKVEESSSIETIPPCSVVVAVLPPALQQAFSACCNQDQIVYLFPIFKRLADERGGVVMQYSGLGQCLKAEIVSQLWAGEESVA